MRRFHLFTSSTWRDWTACRRQWSDRDNNRAVLFVHSYPYCPCEDCVCRKDNVSLLYCSRLLRNVGWSPDFRHVSLSENYEQITDFRSTSKKLGLECRLCVKFYSSEISRQNWQTLRWLALHGSSFLGSRRGGLASKNLSVIIVGPIYIFIYLLFWQEVVSVKKNSVKRRI